MTKLLIFLALTLGQLWISHLISYKFPPPNWKAEAAEASFMVMMFVTTILTVVQALRLFTAA